jgi:uncharacterized protein YyaL (SSP411 family)
MSSSLLYRGLITLFCAALANIGTLAHAARMPSDRAAAPAGGAPARTSLHWEPFSEQLFERAKRERRFVLLDLEAVWCRWCHVMDETTYRDAKVIQAISAHYIVAKADQDANPDLSRRYDEYGWPATIVFAPDGTEIVKRRGYIPPGRMAKLLEAIVADPSPVKYMDQASIEVQSDTPLLSEPLREELAQRALKHHDFKLGGLDLSQKFLDRDAVEFGLLLARRGDATGLQVVKQDLDGALNLIDPVWGGAYQYSTDGDWKHPHYEKLLAIQADDLRAYALAYMVLGDHAYLEAAKNIHRYVVNFLMSTEGAFYVSQDADLVKGQHSGDYFALEDAARRQRGIPAVDRNLYAREQGWMIQALAQLYSATSERQYLDQAIAAANWAIQRRAIAGGGFRHAHQDPAGPYLEDTLAMGRGLLALYAATADRAWLARAQSAADFIAQTFASKRGPGYLTTADRGQVLRPKPQIDENVALARFFNLMARYTGTAQYRANAQRAMRYLAARDVALLRATEPGILLADAEMTSDPIHLTIVGPKDDPGAQTLFQTALRIPGAYRRIEWWDRREGPLQNPDVQYPQLPKAAAFVCTQGACSLPQFDDKALLALARRLEEVRK